MITRYLLFTLREQVQYFLAVVLVTHQRLKIINNIFELMADKISISFDEDNKIRVLEADKFKETDTMRSESMEFMKSIFPQ